MSPVTFWFFFVSLRASGETLSRPTKTIRKPAAVIPSMRGESSARFSEASV